MSTNKGYKPHGYRSDDYMANLPNYNAIIEYAKDPNNELDIQYRDNYINIYYLGGSLLKLKGEGSMEFDEHYYYPPSKKFPISMAKASCEARLIREQSENHHRKKPWNRLILGL